MSDAQSDGLNVVVPAQVDSDARVIAAAATVPTQIIVDAHEVAANAVAPTSILVDSHVVSYAIVLPVALLYIPPAVFNILCSAQGALLPAKQWRRVLINDDPNSDYRIASIESVSAFIDYAVNDANGNIVRQGQLQINYTHGTGRPDRPGFLDNDAYVDVIDDCEVVRPDDPGFHDPLIDPNYDSTEVFGFFNFRFEYISGDGAPYLSFQYHNSTTDTYDLRFKRSTPWITTVDEISVIDANIAIGVSAHGLVNIMPGVGNYYDGGGNGVFVGWYWRMTFSEGWSGGDPVAGQPEKVVVRGPGSWPNSVWSGIMDTGTHWEFWMDSPVDFPEDDGQQFYVITQRSPGSHNTAHQTDIYNGNDPADWTGYSVYRVYMQHYTWPHRIQVDYGVDFAGFPEYWTFAANGVGTPDSDAYSAGALTGQEFNPGDNGNN